MAKLININDALEKLCEYCSCGDYEECDYRCIEFENISSIPTVEAVEVVHGRWIIDDNTLFEQEGCCRLVCSVCGRIVHNVENPAKAMEYRPYCHCGAKMDGDGNG